MKQESDPDKQHKGYVSVLTRSLYYENSRIKEALLRTALLCLEVGLDSFVSCLDDIEVLFSRPNTSIKTLFETYTVKNRFTSELDNLTWPEDQDTFVMG